MSAGRTGTLVVILERTGAVMRGLFVGLVIALLLWAVAVVALIKLNP